MKNFFKILIMSIWIFISINYSMVVLGSATVSDSQKSMITRAKKAVQDPSKMQLRVRKTKSTGSKRKIQKSDSESESESASAQSRQSTTESESDSSSNDEDESEYLINEPQKKRAKPNNNRAHPSKNYTWGQPVMCNECNRMQSNVNNLIRHRRLVHKELPYLCYVGTCKKAFSSYKDASAHIRATHKRAPEKSKLALDYETIIKTQHDSQPQQKKAKPAKRKAKPRVAVQPALAIAVLTSTSAAQSQQKEAIEHAVTQAMHAGVAQAQEKQAAENPAMSISDADSAAVAQEASLQTSSNEQATNDRLKLLNERMRVVQAELESVKAYLVQNGVDIDAIDPDLYPESWRKSIEDLIEKSLFAEREFSLEECDSADAFLE